MSERRFATAKAAFQAGGKLEPTNPQFGTWTRKCEVELQDEEMEENQADSNTAPPAAPVPAPGGCLHLNGILTLTGREATSIESLDIMQW